MMDAVTGAMNSVSGFFKSPSPKLNGQMTDTFCYLSIKDRHPVTITKIIDQAFKLGLNDNHSEDAKEVTAKLSRLKTRLQTDKCLELVEGTGADTDIWNTAIQGLEHNTWFTAPWLFVECYMYRVIHEIFQKTDTLTYPIYDIFREEKCQGLQDSLPNMSKIAQLLHQITAPSPTDLEDFIKLSLWGNKTDLSLLKHFNLELSDVQSTAVDKNNDMILSNDLEKVVKYLGRMDNGEVDIVLDNSGYELFGDLCLAEVLLRSPHVSKVTFHMKRLPWFVSDVTEGDVTYMLHTLTGSTDTALRSLGELWTGRFEDGSFTRTDHVFWSTYAGFSEMEAISPDLHTQLTKSDFLFFKGDLNYRKLVNDRAWPYETCFRDALEGFEPSKLCALRTIKCDAIVGCGKGVVEGILRGHRDQLFCGTYALISSNLSS